jgi:hypothetical protein
MESLRKGNETTIHEDRQTDRPRRGPLISVASVSKPLFSRKLKFDEACTTTRRRALPASYNEAKNIVFLIGRCRFDRFSDKRKEHMSRTIEAIMAHIAPPPSNLTSLTTNRAF